MVLRALRMVCWVLPLAFASPDARAVPLLQVDSFAFASIPGVDFVGFAEFNTPKHILDTVSVKITGNLVIGVSLAPGQSLTPMVSFDAFGAGGQGFGFAGSGARFIFPGVSNPTLAPIVVSLATGFKVDFKLTELTDLTGVVVPSTSATVGALVPPTTVEARRSDFVVQIVPIGIFETLVFIPLNFAPSGPFTGGGSVTLTYTAWPPIAEPDLAGGVALGLLALIALRRPLSRACGIHTSSR